MFFLFRFSKNISQYYNSIRLISKKAIAEKPKKELKNKPAYVSNEIIKYFESNGNSKILQEFPEKLLRKKKKSLASFYVTDSSTADILVKHLTKDMSPKLNFIEVNPGTGILTKRLLDEGLSKIYLMESYDHFLPNLEKIRSNFPGRVTIKRGDFVNIYKLAFQDKMDNGERVADLFGDIPKREYADDIGIRLFAGIGNINFIKHFINSLVFQISVHSYGRMEMFLVLPPPLYIHLTCNNQLGYLFYRAATMLFQIMFEYKFLAKFPRKHFLPWQFDYNLSKSNKLTRINSIDPEYLYLVKITPRKNLYELCAQEDMQAFWYFIKQNCISRRNRIIPNLEKLVPGCGPRLIINLGETIHVKQLYPDENKENLPPYSMPCTTMSNQDFFPHMNIFTQFGDLSPSQMLTLFTEFRSWPEYKESSFLALLQNSLLKMETSDSENVDGIEITEEEDETPVEISEAIRTTNYIKTEPK